MVSLTRLRMHQDNVLVLMDWLRDRRVERRTAGGLIIPGVERPDNMAAVLATVIKAGPGAYDERIAHDEGLPGHVPPKTSRKYVAMDPSVVPGARVLVDCAISGDPLVIDGVEHRVIRATNIIGIVEGEEIRPRESVAEALRVAGREVA